MTASGHSAHPSPGRPVADAPPKKSFAEVAAASVRRLWFGLLCRALDLAFLLVRPGLLRPYLSLWRTEKRHTPFSWPRDFEAKLALARTGQKTRELMYGEAPLCTVVLLLRRAGVGQKSHVLDLGAGRGRVLLAARWLGAEATGVELYAPHVRLAREAVSRAGASLVEGDAGEVDASGATHVFLNWCAFGPATKERVLERLGGLGSGARVLAVAAFFPEGTSGLERRWTRWGLFTWGLEEVACYEKRSG